MRRYTRTTATTGETKSEERSRHAATHAPVLRACLGRMRGRCRACAAPRSARKGGATAWLLAQRARDSPLQKVHCIYKSFIMNYTMVYLKWEACLVRGYMGYRDYNACREEREREKPGLQRAWDTRNRALSCRCSRVRTHHHRGEGRLPSLFLPSCSPLSLLLPVYLRIVHATHARVYKLVVRSRMLAPG